MKLQSKIILLSLITVLQPHTSYAWFFSANKSCDLNVSEKEAVVTKELVIDNTVEDPGSSYNGDFDRSRLNVGFYIDSDDPDAISVGLRACENSINRIQRTDPSYIPGTMSDCLVEIKKAARPFTISGRSLRYRKDDFGREKYDGIDFYSYKREVYTYVAKATYKVLQPAPAPEEIIKQKLDKITMCIKSEQDHDKLMKLIETARVIEGNNIIKKFPRSQSSSASGFDVRESELSNIAK